MEPDARSIPLWPGQPPESKPEEDFRPSLDLYPVETRGPRGAVVICPGGGYCGRAPHEGAGYAARFNAAGLHAFVVQYRVSPHRHPAPLLDAARAVRIVRDRAGEWNVRPDRVAVCGSSAGGHVAASLAVHSGDPAVNTGGRLDAVGARPDALILCYPVITTGEFAHRGSIDNLLGPDASDGMLRKMSLELHVTEKTPPTFLWNTANDPGVPVENSLLFAAALSRHHVPFELHVYPDGAHGIGLAEDNAHVATWAELCGDWFAAMGF